MAKSTDRSNPLNPRPGGNQSDAFVESIAQLAVDATDVETLEIDADPHHITRVFIPQTGKIETIVAATPPRGHRCDSLDSLAEAVERWRTAAATIFIGEERAVVVLDEKGDRRDTLDMPLTATAALTWLRNQDKARRWYTPTEMLLEARTQLAGNLPADFALLLRSVRLESSRASTQDQGTGYASVSAEAQRKALFNGKEPPEEVILELFCYEQLAADEAYRMKLRLAFEVDVEKGKLTLIPLAGEIETVIRQTRDVIAKQLRTGLVDSSVLILHGAP